MFVRCGFVGSFLKKLKLIDSGQCLMCFCVQVRVMCYLFVFILNCIKPYYNLGYPSDLKILLYYYNYVKEKMSWLC